MDAVSLGFSALAIVSILAVTALLAVVENRFASADWAGTVLIAGVGGAIVALACFLQLLVLPLLLIGPLAALGALFATLSTSLLRSHSTTRRLGLAAASTALVFLPLAWTVFATTFDPFGTQLGVIDLGGGVPTLVGGGAVALGTALTRGRGRIALPPKTRGWRVLIPAILAWIAGVGWVVGLELAADDMVPVIAVSALVMPALAAVAASLVERIRFGRTTPSAIVVGLLAGIAAVVPACAFVTAPLAAVIGVIVGAVTGVLPQRMSGWPATALALGAAISTMLLGAFGAHIGYIYTGQPELAFGQLSIVLLAVVGGGAVGTLLGWLSRRWPSGNRADSSPEI
ncbi:ammonium transporter [Glaciihabitans sp. INWT7]|uniref:ammonium transporter n=1 Tax=Glaciihabitans sp. INWT7 TaxID=2596912 RepID=UPI00162698FF|nr:ammonium transporter [Glaciihabitans sp. INWT7]QNE46922.1 ammonium transporter [Glaciihabitans sp. INWT7]